MFSCTKAQPINSTPEQKLGRALSNMTLAMSGQSDQMHPDDKAEFERGVQPCAKSRGLQLWPA
jgi:hypothetical protein